MLLRYVLLQRANFIGSLLFSLLLVGCAIGESAFDCWMKTFIGTPIDQYERTAGPPNRIDQVPNRNAVYVYQLKNYARYNMACTIFLEVNKDGIIVTTRHEGKDCIARSRISC